MSLHKSVRVFIDTLRIRNGCNSCVNADELVRFCDSCPDDELCDLFYGKISRLSRESDDRVAKSDF